MFITNNANRAPIQNPFGEIGNTYWTTAELAMQQIWFLLALGVVDRSDPEPFEMEKTLLLSDLEQVTELLELNDPDLIVRAVYIVTPSHVNQGQGWSMDQLIRVWTAQEPDEVEHFLPVYETISGKRYCYSLFFTPANKLINPSLRYELPITHR